MMVIASDQTETTDFVAKAQLTMLVAPGYF